MDNVRQAGLWLRQHPLPLALAVQAGLLFCCLELLPAWGDEQFTLNLLKLPAAEVLDALRRDIHPPLYYFLARWWDGLPLPGGPAVRLRALSAALCLAATVVVYALWVRQHGLESRWRFLLLWTFSPALILYARMGRSYTLQLLAAAIVIWLALWWLEDPPDLRRLAAYSAGVAALLYIHYLPGLAVAAAAHVALLAREYQTRRRITLLPLAISDVVIAVLYAPWMFVLAGAMKRVAAAETYSLSGNVFIETALKLGYGAVSFTLGESPPVWALAGGAVLVPAAAGLVWAGVRGWRPQASFLAAAAAAAFLGAASWVSYPFIPARLLFLLPFFLLLLVRGVRRLPVVGTLIFAGLLAAALGSLANYYQAQGLLNKGYLIPFRQMAETIRRESGPEDSLVIVDRYNSDPSPLLAALGREWRVLAIEPGVSREQALAELRSRSPRTVWHLRNTHDVSPEGIHRFLERRLTAFDPAGERFYIFYSWLEKRALRFFLDGPAPDHHYRMSKFRRAPPADAER